MTELRRLGRTDLKVSPIALGSMTWGEQNTEAQGHAQLDRAFGRGVNFVDAAEIYPIPPRAETQGDTERFLGTWLKARGQRDRVVIATKVSGRSDNTYLRPGSDTPQLDRKNIHYAIDQSLKRLQTDYVDLYQLHSPDRAVPLFGAGGTTYRARSASPDAEVPIEETLDALAELVTAGKCATSACRTRPRGALRASSTRPKATPRCPASCRSRTPTASSTAPSRSASPKSPSARTSACSPIRRSARGS
jgi:aryl-alcohol dehydrogenase-like predicted oxidoreductase